MSGGPRVMVYKPATKGNPNCEGEGRWGGIAFSTGLLVMEGTTCGRQRVGVIDELGKGWQSA